jgi:protocatechuate 3,4-dioxygenase beta subunit
LEKPSNSINDFIDVAGEYVRQDITDSEPGVPLVVDFDVFDVETCEPLTDTYVEIWSK